MMLRSQGPAALVDALTWRGEGRVGAAMFHLCMGFIVCALPVGMAAYMTLVAPPAA